MLIPETGWELKGNPKKVKMSSLKSGNYLYRDGIIQTDDREFRWFYPEDTSSGKILHCYGTGDTGGYWSREELLKGECKCLYDTYLFTEDGVPATGTFSILL